MSTKVVNIYKEPYDVYIGRAGKGKDGPEIFLYWLGAILRIVCFIIMYKAVVNWVEKKME